MEQFDSSEEASSRVLEQQQRNDEQQCYWYHLVTVIESAMSHFLIGKKINYYKTIGENVNYL